MNPKAKGSAFERKIAKFLTEWISGQCNEYYFWRSPASGGIATILEENGTIAGDIIALKPEATTMTNKFSIEAKCGYPQSSFHKFLNSKKDCEIVDFWKQTVDGAAKANRRPMLFYHKKGMNILVGVDNPSEFLMKSVCLYIPSVASTHVYFYDMKQYFSHHTPKILLDNEY